MNYKINYMYYRRSNQKQKYNRNCYNRYNNNIIKIVKDIKHKFNNILFIKDNIIKI